MSTHDPREPDRDREDADLVGAFFAGEREQVPDLGADEVTWARIRQTHRDRRRRRSTMATGLGAAAAAVGIAGYLWWPTLFDADPTPPAAPDSSPMTTQDPTTGEPTPSVSVGEVVEVQSYTDAAPSDLGLISVSAPARGDHVAIGAGTCASGPCQLLLSGEPSQDGHWQITGSLELAGSAQGLRLGPEEIGYLWTNAEVYRTSDAGQTWEVIGAGLGQVHDVLVTDDQVSVASTDGDCREDDACSGLHWAVAAHDAEVLEPTLVSQVEDQVVQPRLTVAGEAVFLVAQTPTGADGDHGTGLWTWQDGPQNLSGALSQCAAVHAVAGSADDPAMTLICTMEGEDEPRVFGSDTAGRTWAPTGEPLAVDPPALLATTASTGLVLVADGSVQVSRDGGQSWGSPEQPPADDSGQAFTFGPDAELQVSAEGRYLLAGPLTTEQVASYWVSDDGDSWTEVDVTP